MAIDVTELSAQELAKIWLPWTDESIFDDLSDEEAEELMGKLVEETGLEHVLRPDAPPEVVEAFLQAQIVAKREAEEGIVTD